MIDVLAVTVVYCVDELHKDSACGIVLANVITTFGNVCEEVAFWAVFQDDICAVNFLNDLMHRDDVGVC